MIHLDPDGIPLPRSSSAERRECRKCSQWLFADEFEGGRQVCRKCRRNAQEIRRLKDKIKKLLAGPRPLDKLEDGQVQCSVCGDRTNDLPGRAKSRLAALGEKDLKICRKCVIAAHREALVKRMRWTDTRDWNPQAIIDRLCYPQIYEIFVKGHPEQVLDPWIDSMVRGQYALARKDPEIAKALSIKVGD